MILISRNIDLIKAIRTFLAVVEEQGFSAASRKLDLVTSAVSRQVADLEKHFGCQLLYRTTRAMHLTAEGKHFVAHFKDILSRLDGLEDIAHVRREQVTGELSITTPGNAEGLGLRQAVSKFMSCYPDVKVIWQQMNRYVNLVDEGIDLAVRAGPMTDSSLIARKYKNLEVHYVASPDYLEKHGTPDHPSNLAKFPCIIELTSNNPRRWRYYEKGKERLVNVYGNIEVNEAKLVAAFAAAGDGIAQLPEFLLQPYLSAGEVVPILKPYEVPPIPLSLVYPANRLMKPALREF
ncbi:MAG: LysR family transcriptional regulator, partial [Kordiimonas sp.]